MRTLTTLAALSLLAVTGCGGPGRDLFHGGEMPSVDERVNPIYTIAPGIGPLLSTGNGYLIAATAVPNATLYRVVWTNDSGVRRRFTGSAWTPGNFTTRDPGCTVDNSCRLESDDFVSTVHAVSGGNRIDWDTFASGGDLDGVDFTVDVEPAMFDFFIDGVRVPTNVVFPDATSGGADASVERLPFGLHR